MTEPQPSDVVPPPAIEDVKAAARRIAPWAHRTPVVTNRSINARAGAELLFQVFADRYERASILLTSNLPFSEWDQVFQGERMTAALLDRLTHHCHIFEMNGQSYRFRESVKAQTGKKGKDAKEN